MADARNPALSLTTQVQDLTTALNDESGATDTGLSALATFHGSMVTLGQDMTTSGDKAGYFTSTQRATAEEIAQVDGQAKAASEALKQQGDSASRSAAPLEQLRGELEKLQDPTKAEKELIHELSAEIAALKSKNITIGIKVLEETGSFSQAAAASGIAPSAGSSHYKAFAAGGVIPGYGGGDTYGPIMVERGETIVPKHLTPRYAPQFAKDGIPGFAGGGAVGQPWGGWNNGGFEFDLFLSILNQAGAYSTSSAGVSDADRLAKEFADGTLKTVTEIRDAGTEAIDALKDYYTGPHAQLLEGALREQTSALEKLASKSASIATEIANMKAFASQETQSLQSFSALSNITGTVNSTTGVAAAPTGSQIESGLQADLAQLKKFYDLIGKLKKAGVAVSLIQQVIAMGPAQGIQYAEAILSGGQALIKEINSEESAISKEETKLGDRAADIQYGQNISKGFLSGLKKEKTELDKEMKRLGEEIAKELEDALHGKSVKVSSSTDVSVSDATSADVTSVGGTTGGSATVTSSEASRIVSELVQIAARETTLLTKAQGTEIIALLKAAPKATGSAAGTAVADALDSAAGKAAAKARTRVRG